MPEQRARSGLLANLLLLLGSLVFSALLLAMAEGGLRLVGVGADNKTSRLKYQQLNFPTLHESHRPDGTAVLRTTDGRLPYQSVLRDKPPGTLRVFTFGGSATAGLGYSPNVTFARELERMLQAAYPQRSIEVVNLGIVALASAQVKLLVAEASEHYDADLLVVYSGNNEFLEVHAEKFQEASATTASRVRGLLQRTNLYRVVNTAIRGAPRAEVVRDREYSAEDLRLTQDRIIEQVEMSDSEITEVVDRYQKNIEEMVDAAQRTGTPILLATVASNWEWRGRNDLPEGWIQEFLGEPSAELTRETYERALLLLSETLDAAPRSERYEWYYKRGLVQAALGNTPAARDDFRASMNHDPHLRRALDAMADRVRRVARERGVGLVDAIEVLSKQSPSGIVGFEDFYDYVHLTPRGTVLLAAEIFHQMQEIGLVEASPGFLENAYVETRLAKLATLRFDALDARDFIGFGFDPKMISDRDLWKYDEMLESLDQRLEQDPNDVRALVYRGNAHFFKNDGAKQAARDYQAALSLENDPSIRANLDRLLTERVP